MNNENNPIRQIHQEASTSLLAGRSLPDGGFKLCYNCGRHKPKNEYCKDKSKKDGLFHMCMQCSKERYKLNKDKILAQGRKWRKINKDRALKYYKKYVVANRAKVNAAQKARFNIEIKPCFFCGSTKYVHRHHSDYSKPLDIWFLCAEHHSYIHRMIRAKEKALKEEI